ncbi:hypothetical protein ScPMuIL_016054 [Solemya velum]
MGSLWSVFWVFLLTGLNPHHKGAVAIDCWVCSSDTDAGCGESINTVVLQENKKTGSGCSACKKSFHAIGTVWFVIPKSEAPIWFVTFMSDTLVRSIQPKSETLDCSITPKSESPVCYITPVGDPSLLYHIHVRDPSLPCHTCHIYVRYPNLLYHTQVRDTSLLYHTQVRDPMWSTVDRTCVYQAEDYCDDVLGYGDCVCTTTYCNGLSSAQSGIWKITFNTDRSSLKQLSIKRDHKVERDLQMEKNNILLTLGLLLSLLSCVRLVRAATVVDTTLSHDKLQLLNVAVKGRLVSLLSETLNETQEVRDALAKYIESCVELTSREKECRMCAKERCIARMQGCRLDVPSLSEMMIVDDPVGASGVHMMGVEFIGKSPDVARGVTGFANNARNDILGSVPIELRETSSHLLDNRELGFNNLRDSLQMRMNSFQGSISEIDRMLSNPDVIMNNAMSAADELAMTLRKGRTIQQRLETNARYVMDQMPGMMFGMDQRLRNVQGAMSSVMREARSRINNAMGE